MSPITENPNLSADQPGDPKIETQNKFVHHSRKAEPEKSDLENPNFKTGQITADGTLAPKNPDGQSGQGGASVPATQNPAAGIGSMGSITRHPSFPKPESAAGGKAAKEANVQDKIKQEKQKREDPKGEKTKAETPPKTVLGDKPYVHKNYLKFNLWKSDELRRSTKLGRNERAGLVKDLFPDRTYVRKDDIKKTIRDIDKGKIKPPAALGSGRIGRTRTTNILRGWLGEKPKKVF